MKKSLVVLAAVLSLNGVHECHATASITWAAGATGRVYSDVAQTILLAPFGGNSSPTVGCFVQLIYTANGSFGIADLTTANGIAASDAANLAVVATCWIGRAFGSAGGFTGKSFTSPYDAGARFFVRAWTAPSADLTTACLTTASVPTGGSVKYGNSVLWTQTKPLGGITETDPLDLSNVGSFATTLTPVPEPASMALFGLGAVAIALRRKLRS